MRNRKILSLVILILILLSTSTIWAASDSQNEDYDTGYNLGLKLGLENFDADPPISSVDALNNYLDTVKLHGIKYVRYFSDGFFDGYEAGLKGRGIKVNFADILGTTIGEVYSIRDLQDNKYSNWNKVLPSNAELIRMFNLDIETSEYEKEFLSTFTVKFAEGYLATYEKTDKVPKKDTLEIGLIDGEDIGKIVGNTFGVKDFHKYKIKDYKRNFPSNEDITKHYSLNSDSSDYNKGFLSGFKKGYILEYNRIFEEATSNFTIKDEADAFKDGEALGLKSGEIKATDDHKENKTNNWERSQPIAREIIIDYNLTLYTEKYRNDFISGFYDGYPEGYKATYLKIAPTESIDTSATNVIPIGGGSLSSADGIFTVSVKAGAFYNPVTVTIDTLTTYDSYIGENFIQGSEPVNVGLVNPSDDLNNDKLIELKFEYYGNPYKSGIYKLVDNKWSYLISEVKDGYIETLVKPSNFSNGNGIYIVLLNKNTLFFRDIRNHWAKDEIETLVRRNIIYGYTDESFKPENKITRAEFLTLLSREYNWKLPVDPTNTTQFKDYASFGNRDKIISYALSSGYIKGYGDNTFKPNDHISYKEIEIIMSRFTEKEFKWYNISAKMLYEKKTRSTSYDNMNNKITRGEISYMLYILNEWRY